MERGRVGDLLTGSSAATPRPAARGLRLGVAPALALGLVAGAGTFLLLQLIPQLGGLVEALCTGCNAVGRGDVVTAAGVAGATVGGYAAKSAFENWLGGLIGSSGPVPIFKVKKIIDIASQETPEDRARVAMDAYKDLVMIKNAPPGSTGGDLNEAIDRFTDFATGKTKIDGDDD